MAHVNRSKRTVAALLGTLVLAVAALSVTPTLSAQSESRAYDVELVIFRNLGPGGTTEQWPATPAALVTDAEAPAPTSGDVSYPKLPAPRMKLSGVFDALKRNKNYQPLAHVGWTQPGSDRENAKFVSLSSLGVESGLDGRVALSRGRYLHLTLDMALQVPGEDARYVIKKTRRMRSGERHYIDHPRFGIVALVTPSTGGSN